MPTIDAAVRHDLSDAQWALLQPLLPPPATRGRPRRWPLRSLVDGVRHRVRVGCPWRDVPDRYGPWWRVYALFACWQLLGVWVRIEAALRARADSALAADVLQADEPGLSKVFTREELVELLEEPI